MEIAASELIINTDGSIYHLNLLPKDLASTVITVGDPDRVSSVTKHFDTIEVTKQKREFKTVTGVYKGKRITVISTGIGTDNIDIVFNELDALVNIDFETRTIKDTHTSLDIIRIGTSGTLQNSIPIDSFLISEKAIGFDSLMHFYESDHVLEKTISDAFVKQTSWASDKSTPYVVSYDETLGAKFKSDTIISGLTATNVGFTYNNQAIINLEMETAGIYGMAKLLGHKAVSLNAILANRATGEFSNDPSRLVDKLITFTLDKIVS